MPSLYEATAATGDVSSSDFTTLYNASGLTVPNAGAGAVTGNLNVSGNLTVQGTSNLIGAVTIGNTLSTPNYTFPLPDGTTDQVLVTDGNGNLYWTDVTAIPGAAYQIEATTTTGGANLTLLDSAGGTDSVKFAGGTNITVSRTNANTITISTDADNIPDGTQDGQILTWETGAWTATNNIVWNGTANRTTFTGKNPGLPTGRTYAPAGFVTDTGAIAYGDGDGASLIMGIDSDTQAVKYIGSISSAYGTTGAGSRIAMATTTDSFTSHTATSITGGNTLVFTFAHGFSAGSAVRYNSSTTNGLTQNQIYYVLATGLTTTQCQLSLTQGGSAIALTNGTGLTLAFYNNANTIRVFSADTNTVSLNGTNLILNANAPGVPAVNATISVERGSSGADAYLAWNESGQRWEFNNQVFASGAFVTDADYITINNDNTATNSYFNFTGSGKAIYWDNANSRIATTDKLYVAGNINATGIITIDGDSVSINNDNTATDSYVNFKGFTQYLKWDNTNQRFQFSDKLYITTDSPSPGIFERRVTSADVSPNEGKSVIRLFERVTDAADNNNDIGGPGVIFGRTYGTSGGTERLFGSIAGIWHGTTTTADMQFNWSNDNFNETSPGVFPGTFTMLRLGSTNAEFLNNSIYVDYTTAGSTKTGINMDTPAHTLDIAGDTNMTGNLIVNTNALFVNAATGRVGVGTNTPSASLDVQGNAQLTGDVAVNGGDITTSATTFNLVNTTATTVNIAGAATTVSIGANTGTTTINNDLVADSVSVSGNLVAGKGLYAKGIMDATFTDGIVVDYTTGNGRISTGSSDTLSFYNGGVANTLLGQFSTGGTLTVTGDVAVNGGDITTPVTGVATLFNANATTLNIGGAATAVNIGATTGTTIVNNDFQVHPSSTTALLQIGSQANYNAGQVITTSTAITAITTTTRNAMNGTINIHDSVSGAYHVVNFTALRNGATAMLTTYGELYTGSALANFTADISSGSLRVLATPASANSTTFNVVRTSIT